MDADRFESALRAWSMAPSRRAVGRIIIGVLVGGTVGAAGLATDAKKKRRRKKKRSGAQVPPPVGCPNGTQLCGGSCCPAATCIGGACCPALQACGTVCCPAGQRCGDAATATCVAGQGTCAAGADTCAGANAILCNNAQNPLCVCVQATDGTTRCGTMIDGIQTSDCGLCSTDADCRLQFPDIVGVFCTKSANNFCACPVAGQNICGRPCPTL